MAGHYMIFRNMNISARGGKIIEAHAAYQIHADISTYIVLFDAKKSDIEIKNTHFRNDSIINL